MSDVFDVVVIGGGPGGYVCAIRAAQLGLKTACVEKRGTLGGTCLNVGCIPSKALLHSSHLYEEADKHFKNHGIHIGKLDLDLPAMMARKDDVVDANVSGIDFLFKKNKVTYLKGTGTVKGADCVDVALNDGGTKTLTTKNVVIATGSEVTPLAGVEIDERQIVSSTGALVLAKVPKKMIVIGAGVIGLELGSVWRRLGAEVTVVEYLDDILPGMDKDIVRQATRIFKKQGLKFDMGTRVTGAKKTKTRVTLACEPAKGGEGRELTADVVLVAIGRRPYTQGLGLDALGVEMDGLRIKVDQDMQTNIQGIFAIGDVIHGPMLAHKAEEDGVALAEMLAGEAGHVDYAKVPGVVYTDPEIASVGMTEQQVRDQGINVNIGKFPFTANGRARAMDSTDGLVKIIADAGTDTVIGVHIIGPEAGDLLAECVLGMEFGASSEDIARTCHSHPALGEAVKEAALDVHKRAIHI